MHSQLGCFFWRKMSALSDCKNVHRGTYENRAEWYTDVGYCIDRETLDCERKAVDTDTTAVVQ